MEVSFGTLVPSLLVLILSMGLSSAAEHLALLMSTGDC